MRERLTVCIGPGEATKVGAIALAHAGDEERHGGLLRLRGPALEPGRISPASKRRTLAPRRLAIAIRRNAPRAVE